ncbi:hypothetical protein [Arthrobacter sp. D2-10]
MPQIELDLPALMVGVAAIGTLVWSVLWALRGRKDTKQQQEAANELANREQHWEELQEDNATLRSELRQERADNNTLRTEIRARDVLARRHSFWDFEALRRLGDSDIGDPPDLYPN